MQENLSAEKPQVEDTIPSMNPGESPEDYKKRLVAMSHEVSDTIPQPTPEETPEEFKARVSNDPHYAMLKEMTEGTYHDETPKEPEENAESSDEQAA